MNAYKPAIPLKKSNINNITEDPLYLSLITSPSFYAISPGYVYKELCVNP